MSFSRIFGILELELSQHLYFAFSITENLTRPGSTTLRPLDRFRFTVWAVNNSGIPLKSIEGSISPTPLAEFDPSVFDLSRLSARRRRQIATIEARIVPNMGRGCVRLDQIGTVQVAISADLSRFRIEKSRPLTYLKSA